MAVNLELLETEALPSGAVTSDSDDLSSQPSHAAAVSWQASHRGAVALAASAIMGIGAIGMLIVHMNTSKRATAVQMTDVASVSRAYHDYQCDSDEWHDFLRKFSLDDEGAGAILDWHSFRDEARSCSDHNVLWLWPAADHNNAYQINKAACYRLMKWSQHACSVSVLKTSSIQHAKKLLNDYPDASLKMVGLGGHGSPVTLQWGKCNDKVPPGTTCKTSRAVTLWESPTSWSSIGSIKKGASVVTKGPMVVVEGYELVPISEGGALELSSLDCGSACGLGMDDESRRFLTDLKQKMHHDSTLLLDSCSTAEKPQQGSTNLAKFVSDVVGNGIRVLAAGETLYTTNVERWDPFYANMNGKDPVIYTKGATCPDWARTSATDRDGDCLCPSDRRCMSLTVGDPASKVCKMTRAADIWESTSSWNKIGKAKAGDVVSAAGAPSMSAGYFMLPIQPRGAVQLVFTDCRTGCPMSFGHSSEKHFLPSCSDSWSSIQCGCAHTGSG